MKHLPRAVVVVCLSLVLFACPRVARADLESDVNALLTDKVLKKAVYGIEIIRLGAKPGDDKPVFRKDPALPLIPASNLKLVTTSALLAKVGPDFKYRTSLALGDGDVAIIGAGDPSFGDLEMLKSVGWSVTTVYENWADQLIKKRITSVHDVLVDDSIFDEEFLHPNWPLDQIQKRYSAEVGGLSLNANVIEFSVKPTSVGQVATYTTNPDTRYVTVRNTCVTGTQNAIWLSREAGSNQIVLRGETPSRAQIPVAVTIHDPPMFAGAVFADVLRRKGVEVTGSVKRDRTVASKGWRVLAVHETPLIRVMARANKESVNLYAESMCKLLGHEATGQAGSWANGTAATAEFLKSAGVAETEFKLDDGCGLSKRNAISAEALAKVLSYVFHSPNRDVFRGTLAVAATDGTLQDRFRGDLRGRVFAKSGYVNGVCSLSGYLHTRDDQWFAFSFILNRISSLADVKQLSEKIVKAVDANAAALASAH